MAVERLSQASIGTLNKYSSMMAGSAFLTDFVLISTQLLASTTTSVSFSSIPSTFRHLQLRVTSRDASGGSSLDVTFNGDTAANYARHYVYGNGSAVASSGATSQNSASIAFAAGSSATANVFSAAVIDILDYGQTTKNKTIRSLSGYADTTNRIGLMSGLWMGTAAVTSLTVAAAAGSFATDCDSLARCECLRGENA